MAHPFNFICEKKLSFIGATWFVSYCFHILTNSNSHNWQRVSTHITRTRTYDRTKWWVLNPTSGNARQFATKEESESFLLSNLSYERLHHYWMLRICRMKAKKLNRNSIGFRATAVGNMARQCLPLL